jgi:hypothetical protein
MLDIHQLLLDRLHQQGVDSEDGPPFLRDLLKILESYPDLNPDMVNSKIQLLGWNGVAVDYQSLQLALAWMESKNPRCSKAVDSNPGKTHF